MYSIACCAVLSAVIGCAADLGGSECAHMLPTAGMPTLPQPPVESKAQLLHQQLHEPIHLHDVLPNENTGQRWLQSLGTDALDTILDSVRIHDAPGLAPSLAPAPPPPETDISPPLQDRYLAHLEKDVYHCSNSKLFQSQSRFWYRRRDDHDPPDGPAMTIKRFLQKAISAEEDGRFYYYNGVGSTELLAPFVEVGTVLTTASLCKSRQASAMSKNDNNRTPDDNPNNDNGRTNENVKQTLWISTAGVVAPTHYDTHENVLAQVFGSKMVELWPHKDAERFEPYAYFHPRYRQAKQGGNASSIAPMYAINLTAGNILYIPPGVWHRVTATSRLSVSVSSHCDSAEDVVSDKLAKLPFDSIDPATDALTLSLYLRQLMLVLADDAAAAVEPAQSSAAIGSKGLLPTTVVPKRSNTGCDAAQSGCVAYHGDDSDSRGLHLEHAPDENEPRSRSVSKDVKNVPPDAPEGSYSTRTLFGRVCGGAASRQWQDQVSEHLQAQIAAYVGSIRTAFKEIQDLALQKTMADMHGTIVINAIAGMLDTGYGDMLEPTLADFRKHCGRGDL